MDNNNQFDTNPISIRGSISEDKKNTLPKVADFIRLVESFLDVYDSRVSLVNADGELVYTSNNSKQVIGYSFDDFEILETLGYIHPDDRKEIRKAFLETAQGFSETKTYRIFRSTGELRWIQGIAIPHSPKGKLVGIFIIERDVTNDEELYLENKPKNFFQDIIQMINYPILFIQNNLIVWSNDVLYDKYQFTKEDIINHPLEKIFTSKEEFANFLQKCNSELKNKGSMNFYGSLKGNNNISYSGVYLTNSLAKNTLAKGYIIIFLELSDFINNLKEKAEQSEFSFSIINNVNRPLLLIQEGKIQWVNDAGYQEFNYTDQELLNQPLNILFPSKEEYAVFLKELNKAFLHNQNFLAEITIQQKNSTSVPYRVIGVNSQDSKLGGYVLFFEPIGHLKSLVNQLREEKSELEFYCDLLCHDIKNLCQDALSQIDLSILRIDNKEESIKRQRKSMIGIMRISELISSIDKYFKLKRKDYELFKFDLVTSLKEAEERVKMKFDPRKITIQYELPTNHFYISGNELMTEVFSNILDNAITYDRNEVVEIAIKISSSNEKYWQIIIIDNGPGISKNMRKYLFDRYTRSKQSVHGSGFGLTLVKTIVDSYNGKIRVENCNKNDRLQGSKFIIDIPKY